MSDKVFKYVGSNEWVTINDSDIFLKKDEQITVNSEEPYFKGLIERGLLIPVAGAVHPFVKGGLDG